MPCQVTLSSLNRHAVATRADVGLPKATVLARHFDAIFPEASVEAKSIIQLLSMTQTLTRLLGTQHMCYMLKHCWHITDGCPHAICEAPAAADYVMHAIGILALTSQYISTPSTAGAGGDVHG